MLIQEQERKSSMAKLYFKYGAMNCGKSASLLLVAHNYDERDRKVVLIKPKCDTKGESKIVSRVGMSREVDYLISDDESIIKTLSNTLKNIDCILVDEAQFLKKEHVDELFIITKIYDVSVICFGLKSDFKTESFPGSKRLFELADELDELGTICRCGTKARFNARIVNGKFVSDGEQVAIDGKDSVTYESLCGKCYLEKVMGITKENNLEKVMILKKYN